MITVILATPDDSIVQEMGDFASETGSYTFVQTVNDTVALTQTLELTEADVVIIDVSIGPLSALDIARDLTQRFPDVGLVLLSESGDSEVLERAIHAGFRGVIAKPLGLEDVSAKIENAGTWSQRLRERMTESPEDRRGRMIVLAGAKGGVGTTTLATHIALEAQLANPERRICLVDFDLQAGDIRTLMDLTHHRSVDDLVEVAHEVSARHLNEALYGHSSGLRILLPPPQGEHEADVTAEVARGILGAIRTRFDLVVADVGSVVTDGGAMATELADEVLLVVTPDVLCLRSATRMTQLWQRLRYRKDGVTVVVNRASRDTEVQPDLIGRVLDLPVMQHGVPAAFRDVEASVNSGIDQHLPDGPVRQGVIDVARELQLIRPKTRRSLFGRGGNASGDEGQAAIEFVGYLLPALCAVFLLWQMVIAGWTFTMAEHAVREGARELAVSGPVASNVDNVVRRELPESMRDGVQVSTSRNTVSARVRVPLLAPGWMSPWTITVRQGTYREGGF